LKQRLGRQVAANNAREAAKKSRGDMLFLEKAEEADGQDVVTI